MMDDLYPYYERELAFMRELAGEFAVNYPQAAARLNLERHRCDDPHTERLIEAFSLIAARIHHRLDADFPEITQSLLNLVYPHYLRPIPSASIVQFRAAEAARLHEFDWFEPEFRVAFRLFHVNVARLRAFAAEKEKAVAVNA